MSGNVSKMNGFSFMDVVIHWIPPEPPFQGVDAAGGGILLGGTEG
jgi:hypothetical protein